MLNRSASFDAAWANTPLTRQASVETVPSASEQEQVFAALMQGPNGLKRVAFAMQQPLKNRLDYVAVGRKLFLVDELPQGEIPAYDLDIPEYGAVKVAARGVAPQHEVNIKRITIPTFPISIDTVIKWEEIQIRRYPAFDRAKERCAIAAAIAEDDEIVAILERAATVGPYTLAQRPNFPTDVAGGLDKNTLATLYGSMAQKQLAPGAYVMNPRRFADILKWTMVDLDQVSLNVIIETGQFGVIFGTRLIMSTRVDPTKVYLVSTPDKTGRIPERKAVEVKIFDNIPQNQYDIVAWEQIGIGCHNTAAVIRSNQS